MKTVGGRLQPALAFEAQGELLAAGARFSESLAAMGTQTFIPKGLYRFSSLEAANRHQFDCIANGLAARVKQSR